jgi:hypothetical protein
MAGMLGGCENTVSLEEERNFRADKGADPRDQLSGKLEVGRGGAERFVVYMTFPLKHIYLLF